MEMLGKCHTNSSVFNEIILRCMEYCRNWKLCTCLYILQIETRQGSESPPLYDTFPSSTLKESIVEKPAKMVVEPHHQSESSTFPRDGKKLLKPPPPKPYERPTPVKVIAATKPSMPSTVVKTNCDVEIGTACVEKDAEVEDIEGYTYVLMNPKDSNTTKHNAASVVSEIRSNNKQYLASLNIDEVITCEV